MSHTDHSTANLPAIGPIAMMIGLTLLAIFFGLIAVSAYEFLSVFKHYVLAIGLFSALTWFTWHTTQYQT